MNDISYPDVLPTISQAEIEALRASMDSTGVGVWNNAVPAMTLAAANAYVDAQLREHGRQYFTLHGDDWIKDNPLLEVAHSLSLTSAAHELGRYALGDRDVNMKVVPSIRVLTGALGIRHSERYHYDSYVVTVLVPLIIPTASNEPNGDLVIFPNLRHVRFNVVINIVEKLIVENAIARAFWRTSVARRLFGGRVVKMTPGNIYFFWGIRSLHANQRCDVSRVRCTALFHFGDPHERSPFKPLTHAYHRFRRQRKPLDKREGAP
jgi:hypothetical protein